MIQDVGATHHLMDVFKVKVLWVSSLDKEMILLLVCGEDIAFLPPSPLVS